MPTLSIAVPHGLSQGEAVERIRACVDQLAAEYRAYITRSHVDWRADGHEVRLAGCAAGVEVSGLLSVRPSEVELHLKLPFAAWLFKSKVEQIIRRHLVAALEAPAGGGPQGPG